MNGVHTKHFSKKIFLYVSIFLVLLSVVYHGFFYLHEGKAFLLFKEGTFSRSTFYYERGNHYFGGGAYDIEKALENFKYALRFENTARNPINYQIGRIYFIQGNLQEAILQFNTELMLRPDYKRAYYMRGLTYGYMNMFELAANDFKKFIEWQPNNWAGYNDIAWVYFVHGDFDNAEVYAREGLAVVPKNPWLSNALGAILINKENHEDAEKYLLDAQKGFALLSPEEWGRAYPGNNPRIYSEGLMASRKSVEANLTLAREKSGGE